MTTKSKTAARDRSATEDLESEEIKPVTLLGYLESIGGKPANPENGDKACSGSAEETLAIPDKKGSPQYAVVRKLESQLKSEPIPYCYEKDKNCIENRLKGKDPEAFSLAQDCCDQRKGGGPAPSLQLVVPERLTKALAESENKEAIAGFQQTKRTALAASKSTYQKAKNKAWAAYQDVLDDWGEAVVAYEAAADTAQVSLHTAVADAKETNIDPTGAPSPSTRQDHYYKMKIAATAALITYETDLHQKAADELMKALTSLLTASATYNGAVRVAKATKLNSDAIARQAYWNSVKGFLTE